MRSGRRDLLEAAAHDRRRLVLALTSASPEEEPGRPGRLLLGGALLAGLLVAGAALAGVVAPRERVDWSRPGLVVAARTGAAYVVQPGPGGGRSGGVLRPVATLAAARLVLGPGVAAQVLPQGVVDAQPQGPVLGPAGAPAALPRSGRLVDDRWSACTRDRGGLRLRIDPRPRLAAAHDGAVVVRSDGRYHLLALGPGTGDRATVRRYALPRVRGTGVDNQDNLLADLRVGIRLGSPRVPAAWLRLFPAGDPLTVAGFRLRGAGRPVPYAGRPGVPPGSRVGDVLTSDRGSLLLTAEGPARLDPFALAVYRATAAPSGSTLGRHRDGPGPREARVAALPPVAQARPPYAAARWPDHLPRPILGDPCAVLRSGAGIEPVVRLAGDPAPAAVARPPSARVDVEVAPGAGALVRSGPGRVLLVDGTGTAYPLAGEETVRRLGYAGHPPARVPPAWVALLRPGVRLAADPG